MSLEVRGKMFRFKLGTSGPTFISLGHDAPAVRFGVETQTYFDKKRYRL